MKLIDMLRRAGLALADQALAQVRAKVASRWGVADPGSADVPVPPDVAARRTGTRDRLADPQALWPGDR